MVKIAMNVDVKKNVQRKQIDKEFQMRSFWYIFILKYNINIHV